MWGKNSEEEILELNWTVLNLFSKLRHAMIRNTLDLDKGLPQGYSYVTMSQLPITEKKCQRSVYSN
jgi:hypothetical protein